MQIYVVKPGDSVDSIASRFQISTDSIIYNNQLTYPYPLAVGQALLLSTPEPATEKRTIQTNGFAYPSIEQTVLEETLPFLTMLSVFSYGFTREGNLLPPPADDSRMISLAKQYRTAPSLTLAPLDETGNFNNNLITAVVNDETAADNLISQLAAEVTNSGFEGVMLDFEYIPASDRDPYAAFVRRVRTAINALGYPVSVALAPKISDSMPELLYVGMDYAQLGEAADNVLLMTYEWGYTYSAPMAVAPINKVREVVEYALTKIPPEKINLGIPNYGYDWALPYVQGQTRAQGISNTYAVQLAIDNNAEILFDPIAMSPYFTYRRDGVLHEVWFEDVRSMQEKFALISQYGLMGAGYWQIMNLFRANWLLLADTFQIQKTVNQTALLAAE